MSCTSASSNQFWAQIIWQFSCDSFENIFCCYFAVGFALSLLKETTCSTQIALMLHAETMGLKTFALSCSLHSSCFILMRTVTVSQTALSLQYLKSSGIYSSIIMPRKISIYIWNLPDSRTYVPIYPFFLPSRTNNKLVATVNQPLVTC